MSTLATFSLGLNKNGDAHVSHKIGNSLCSHPALLISDFGGICGVGLRSRIRKLRKVESKRWRACMPETVDRLSQAASREAFGESSGRPGRAPDERGCESSLLYAVR